MFSSVWAIQSLALPTLPLKHKNSQREISDGVRLFQENFIESRQNLHFMQLFFFFIVPRYIEMEEELSAHRPYRSRQKEDMSCGVIVCCSLVQCMEPSAHTASSAPYMSQPCTSLNIQGTKYRPSQGWHLPTLSCKVVLNLTFL